MQLSGRRKLAHTSQPETERNPAKENLMSEIHYQPTTLAIWIEEEKVWFFGTLKEIFAKLRSLES